MEKLSDGIYEPILNWLNQDILNTPDTAMPNPQSMTLPEAWQEIFHMITHDTS